MIHCINTNHYIHVLVHVSNLSIPWFGKEVKTNNVRFVSQSVYVHICVYMCVYVHVCVLKYTDSSCKNRQSVLVCDTKL